jgi:hypothetical protein
MILHDLSTSGCLIETDAALEAGARIELSFGDVLLYPAVVKREAKGLYGCVFEVPLEKRQIRTVGLEHGHLTVERTH